MTFIDFLAEVAFLMSMPLLQRTVFKDPPTALLDDDAWVWQLYELTTRVFVCDFQT